MGVCKMGYLQCPQCPNTFWGSINGHMGSPLLCPECRKKRKQAKERDRMRNKRAKGYVPPHLLDRDARRQRAKERERNDANWYTFVECPDEGEDTSFAVGSRLPKTAIVDAVKSGYITSGTVLESKGYRYVVSGRALVKVDMK